MKFNSKISGILLALFAITILISAVGAGDLVNNGLNNDDFAIDVPSDSDFNEDATTDINSGDVALKMVVFENKGNNSDDVSTIIYLKDSSADNNTVTDFINDLRKDGQIIEETDKYVVVKPQEVNTNVDIADLDSIISFAEGLFSGGDINVSAEGNNVSLSGDGLIIADADGENVYITSDGIQVSGSGSENASDDVNVTVDENITSNVNNGEYAVYLKNQEGNQVITLTGNNLEVLKAMIDTVSFNEN